MKSNNNIIDMINLYFDGELEKEDEAFLFSLISSDAEGRDYFKIMTTLKESYRVSEKLYPQKLEEKILREVSQNPNIKSPDKYYYIPKKLIYALSVILLLVGLFAYTEFNIHREKLRLQSEQVIKQTEMINLLMNSLPQAEVKGREIKKVIVRANLDGDML